MCLRITFILLKRKCFYIKLSTPLIVQETTSRNQVSLDFIWLNWYVGGLYTYSTIIGVWLYLPSPLPLKTWHCHGGRTYSTCGRDSLGHCDLWTAALPFFLLSFGGGKSLWVLSSVSPSRTAFPWSNWHQVFCVHRHRMHYTVNVYHD